jgi:hypothetical protein
MAIKTELINGLRFVTPRDRLSFYATGINHDRLDQIKEAIQSYFPEWAEDEWWWTYDQHERIVQGAIDGRSFDEEIGYLESIDEETGETIESLWMDRVALSVWQANGGFCEFSYDVASIPYEDGHWREEEFTMLTGQSPS